MGGNMAGKELERFGRAYKPSAWTAIASVVVAVVMASALALAWFDPSPTDFGKVIITRANDYITYDSTNYFRPGVTAAGTNWFDLGDTDPKIWKEYNGNPSHPFSVAWPVTIYVWIQTNSAVLVGGRYEIAKLQYMQGTNSGVSTNWVDIATITNFEYTLSNHGAHFGLVTWYPPDTNNVNYLIRIWARLENGMQSASLFSTGIDKNGDGIASDWNDCEVLGLKVIPTKRPGF